jgi:hypothetical protein
MTAVAMTGGLFAQQHSNAQQLSTPHVSQASKLPGERLTTLQRHALGSLGGASVQFDEREVPSAIRGRLSPRAHPAEPAEDAKTFLNAFGSAFRRGPNDDFTVASVETDKAGAQHVRMAQTYKGLPVLDAQLTVDLNKDEITGVSGHFVPDLDLSTAAGSGTTDPTVAVAKFAAEQGYQNVELGQIGGAAVYIDGENAAQLTVPVEIAYDAEGQRNHAKMFVSSAGNSVLATRLVPMAGGGGCTGLNCPTTTQLLSNPGFDIAGDRSWSATDDVIGQWGCLNSAYCAYLDGYGTNHTDLLYQIVTIPANITSATLSFYLKIFTDESTQSPNDTLAVQIRPAFCSTICVPGNTVLYQPAIYSNVSARSAPFSNGNFVRQSFDVTRSKGQRIAVYFLGQENGSYQTSFQIDTTALIVQ